MSAYLSPASFMTQLPAMDKGPLSGFLSGMRDELANQITQQGMQDDALQREVTQQKLDEARQMQPLNVGIRNSEAVKAAADDDYYKSGAYGAMRDSRDATIRSSNDLQVSQNDVNKQMVAAPLWQKMTEELKTMGGNVDWTNPEHRQWWESWRQRMSKFAPNMPVFPDQGDLQKVALAGQQATQFLARQNAGSDRLFQQKKELAAVAPTIQAEASKSNAKTLYDSRNAVEAERTARAKEVQELKNQKQASDAKGLNYARDIVASAIKTGNIDAVAIGAAQDLGEADVNAAVKSGDGSIRLDLLNDPTYRQQLVDAYAERKLPGYKAAKMKLQLQNISDSGASTGQSQQTAPSDNVAGKTIKTPDGTVLKPGDKYKGKTWTGDDPSKPTSWK